MMLSINRIRRNGEQTDQTEKKRTLVAENCPERDSKKSARNSFAPQTIETLVAAFVARGGRIDKIPEAVPTTANDVLQYLHSHNVKVEPAPAKPGEADGRYFYDGDMIDLHSLIERANSHRRRQRLPPFQSKQRSRRYRRIASMV